jgi:hypothetical protein
VREKRGYDRKKENTYKTSIIVRKNISKNKFSKHLSAYKKNCLNKKREARKESKKKIRVLLVK